jgi:hypothetical protein
MARIYLFGGPNQISPAVAKQLAQYGTVIRVTNDNETASNEPPHDTPEDTAIAFSKMWDATGEFGWKLTGPGHGFTLVNGQRLAGRGRVVAALPPWVPRVAAVTRSSALLAHSCCVSACSSRKSV